MKTFITALALTSLIATPAALAQEKFTVDFEFDRAELATKAGTSALYARLQGEIREACNLSSSRKGLKVRKLENQCVEDTTQAALEKISSARLTAFHEAKTGIAAG